MTRGKTIIRGAVILTLANFVTRIMGFIYRIFMSKAIGAQGMGLFQLIVPVYLLVFSLCSSGLATTVSNCTASHMANEDSGGVGKILKLCLALTVVLSVFACVIVFVFSDFIGCKILNEPRTVLSLKIISLCFPFMSAAACLRGYFYGLQKTTVPAISQVLEQIVRIGIVYMLSAQMLSRGLEYACAMAVMGMASGEIASFIFVMIAYYITKNGLENWTAMQYKTAFNTIVAMSVPLTLNRAVSSCLSTIENVLIPQRLQLFGMSNAEAVSVFGGLCGMASPLIMFPCSLLTALATAIMPAISEYSAKKKYNKIGDTLEKSLLFTTVLGIGGAGVFAMFPNEIAFAVYGRNDIADMLRLLGVICPFLYTQVILSAALNGINCQLYIFKMGLLSSAISIASIYFLTPRYGIHAFIAGWAVSAVITNRLSIFKLKKLTGDFNTGVGVPLKCLLAISAVCMCTRYLLNRFDIQGLNLVAMLAVLAGCAVSYICILESMQVWSVREFLTKA